MIPTPNTNNSKDDKENDSAANNAAADKAKRFEGEGVVFKAKLIGSELVMEPRGDKMCQNSITRLKAIIKGTNSHKKRIVLKISLAGIKVYDEKTNEILHDNEVSQISYIASDDSDTRCFGYVCDVPNKAHQFVCFKTSCPAAQVMSTMSELFDAVLKSKRLRESEGEEGSKANEDTNKNKEPVTDLIIGDLSSDEPAIDIKDSSTNVATATTGTVQAAITGNKGFSFDDGFSDMNSQSTPSLTNTNVSQQQQQQRQMSQQSSSMDQSASFIGVAGRVTQMSRANSNSLDLIDDSGIMDNNNDDSVFGAGTGLISNTNKQTTVTTASSTAPPVTIPIDQHSHQQQQQQLAGSHPSNSNQFQPQARRPNNRSLIYNHSSKSLSDAMLPPRQTGSSTNSNILNQLSAAASSSMRQDNYADRYAVFNDIDNLPSIFESTSLNSINNASNDNIINNNNNNNNSSAGAAKVSPFNTDHSFSNSFGNFQSNTNSQAGNFANAHHINSISNNSIGRSGYGASAAAGFKSSGTNIHAATFDFGSNSNLHGQNMFAGGGDMQQQSHHLHQQYQSINYGSNANISHQQDQHPFSRSAMPTAVPQVPRRQQLGFAGNRLSSSFASSGFAGSGAPGTGSDAAAAHKWFSSSSASMGDVISSGAGHAFSSSSTGGPTIAHLPGPVPSTGAPTVAGAAPSNAGAATHQWLASSTASMRSVNSAANDAGSNSNIFRQTNPFDDEFFS